MAGIDCPLCSQAFATQTEYVAHLAEAHGLVDEPGTDSFSPADGADTVIETPVVPLAHRTPPSFAWHAGAPTDTPAAAPPPPPAAPAPPPFAPPGALPAPPPAPPPHRPAAPSDPQVSRSVVIVVVIALIVAAIGTAVFVVSSRHGSSVATQNTVAQSGNLTTTSSTLPPIPPVIGQSTDASTSVDPGEANEVATALWTQHVKAMNAGDRRALAVYESGAALDADIGFLCPCDIPPVYAPQNVYVLMPRQTGWPAEFLATVTYSTYCAQADQPCANTFVAVQPSRGTPWTIALFTSYAGATPIQPEPGYGVYTAPSPPLTAGNTSALPSEFAAYFTAERTTGKPPATTRLADSNFTREIGQVYVEPGSTEARGYTSQVTYTADPVKDPIYSFATFADTTTACGTIRFHGVDTARPNQVITQPVDRSLEGPQLPPGAYKSVVEDGVHMACFRFDTSTADQVLVFGIYGETTSITGVPA